MLRMLVSAVAVLTLSVSAWAQSSTGILQGRVVDSSGLAVPEAQIAIQNSRTGVRQVLPTNSEGRFVQPYLQPGQYQLTVGKAGFQTYIASEINVAVLQTVTLDVKLNVGEVTTTVEVTAGTVQLSTATSSIATVVENKQMQDLPLDARNPFALTLLTPGVIPTTSCYPDRAGCRTGPTLWSGPSPWMGGGRNATSEFTIDGTSISGAAQDAGVNVPMYSPSIESVEEFSVVVNSMSAEYGRTGGGVVNVATRAGTNQWHGVAFEFLRNSKLDANDFFANRAGIPLGSSRRNQFGGSIGGPLVIPKRYDGHDRTFFFFNVQSTRARNASMFTTTVPLPEWIQGDFSNLRNSSGQPNTIYDPQTTATDASGNSVRQPFPNNVIPKDRIDPVAAKLRTYYVLPNTTPTNPFSQTNNYNRNRKMDRPDDRLDLRLDHNISDRFRVFGRVSFMQLAIDPTNIFGNPGTPFDDGVRSDRSYNSALNSIYTFNPTTILNLNFGFGHYLDERSPYSAGFDITELGFPKAVRDQAATLALDFPAVSIAEVEGLGQSGGPWLLYAPTTYIGRGDLTKVRSNHTVKFGGEYRKSFLNHWQYGPSTSFSFNRGFTQRNPVQASATQGFGFASFLLGTMSGGSLSHRWPVSNVSSYLGFYIQDDWRATQSLTLNLGLRYDVDIPRTERYNRLSYFDISAPSPIAGKVPGYPDLRGATRFVTPQDRRQMPTDLNNWGPRFGFSYKPFSKTVFRGGYGLMYAASVMQASANPGQDGFRGSTNVISSLDGGGTPATFLSNPFPYGFNLPLGATEGPNSGASTNLGLSIGDAFFNDWANPVIQQWNFNVQRELRFGLIIEAGYIGSKGNHLIDGEGSQTYNQLPASYGDLGNSLNSLVPNPFFGVITNSNSILSKPTVVRSQLLKAYPQYVNINATSKPTANSLYHAFTLRAERRFSAGLGLLLSLTAGKMIDDSSTQASWLGGTSGSKQDFYNRQGERAVSAQDVSRRLVLSGNYDLPFGKNRKFLSGIPTAANFIIGGWQVNGILTLQTGTPIIITQNQNNTYLGSAGQRPNNNGRSAEKTGPATERLNQWFDTAVFSYAQAFRFGNAPRTLPDVRNPGTNSVDFSLFKTFRIRELVSFQFRAEAYNLTNTPQFLGPGSQLGGTAFGVVNSIGNSPRQIQFALKLMF